MVAIIPLTAAACGSARAVEPAQDTAPPPAAVAVARASTGVIESAIEISGNLSPQTRVDVRPKFAGTLEKVLVRLGDAVAEGAVLATLDRRDIDAQVDAAAATVQVARASVEAADAALTNATQEVERAKLLFEKGAIARQRLEGAEATWRAARALRDLAKANVAQAEAALRRAHEAQRDATLRSPVAGLIVERNYDAGSLVGPGGDTPVVAVADLRALRLEAGVSELDAGRLTVGSPVKVTVQARPGDVYDGTLGAIAPEVDPKNRHFQIEVRIGNRGRQLLSGMYAVARIVVARAEGVTVPREAVFTKNGARAVYRVDGEQVGIVAVTEGLFDAKRVQIVSGVKAGDIVVADARRELADGARVRGVPAQTGVGGQD